MSRIRWPIPSHDASPLAPVTTRIITPVDPAGDYLTNEIKLRDNFSRVVVDGWGTSDSGHVWTNIGDSAAYSDVDGHRGTFEPTVNGHRGAQEVTLGSGHFSGIFRWAFSAAPSSNLNRLEIFLRNTAGTQGSRIRIENNASDDINIYVVDYATGISLPGSKTFTITNTYVYPDEYWMRFEAIGPFVKLKAWKLGDVEPSTWQVEGYDPTDRAKIAFAGTRVSPNQVIFYYDDITVIADPISSATFSEGIADTTNHSATSTQSLLESIEESVIQVNNDGLSAKFERGTQGAGVTTSSAEASETAWDNVDSSGGTITYDNAQKLGRFAAKVDHTAGGASALGLRWSNKFGTQKDHHGRFYMYHTVFPGTGTRVEFSSPGAFEIRMNGDTGKFSVNGVAMTNAIALNKWIRIEYHIIHHPVNGLLEVKLFNDAESLTPTETATHSNINTGTKATEIFFGVQSGGSSNAAVFWFDNMAAKQSGYIGTSTDYHSLNEFTFETLSNSAESTQSFLEGIGDSPGNSATGSQTILSAEAEAANNSGSGSFLTADATAETVSNSAESTQTLDETVFVPGAVKPFITMVKAHSHPELVPVTKFHAVLAVSTLEITDVLTNEGASVHTLSEAEAQAAVNSSTGDQTILSAEAQAANNSGSGSFTVADATAETVSVAQTSTQTILEASADTLINSATAVLTILSAEAQAINNSGSGSFVTADATAETLSNSATADHTLIEFIGGNVIETIDNVGTSVVSILSADAQDLNNAGSGSFTVADATAETVLNSATTILSILEALAETINNSATGVHTLLASDLETLINTGTASHTDGEAIGDNTTNTFATAIHSMLENGTVRLYPDQDISTGTWHDTPLFPKIDEVFPVGGYPTEAIISGEDPVNDTAVLGLQDGSDPSMDIDHFINVQFYKIGNPTDEVDFIVKLKQGASVIATRHFVNVQELEGNPRTERIGLTTGEVANITNYGDLRFEIIANKTN